MPGSNGKLESNSSSRGGKALHLSFPLKQKCLEHVLAGVKQDELCIQVQYLQSHEDVVRIRAVKRKNRKLDLRLIACMVTRHITMPYSHLSRALMATFLLKKVIWEPGLCLLTLVFLDWLPGSVCVLFVCFWVFCSVCCFLFGFRSHANPVTRPLSLTMTLLGICETATIVTMSAATGSKKARLDL